MNDLGLNIQRAQDQADLELVYEESDAPMGITLTLAGPDSQAFKAAENRNNNERLAKVQKNRKVTAEMSDGWRLNLLMGCTLGWKFYPPAVKEGEKGPEFTKANLRAFYTEYPEIADQVDEFIGQRRNFRRKAD